MQERGDGAGMGVKLPQRWPAWHPALAEFGFWWWPFALLLPELSPPCRRGAQLSVPLTTLEAEPPFLLREQTPDSRGPSLMTCHGRLLASPYLRVTMFAVRSSPQGHPRLPAPTPPVTGGPQERGRGC